MSKEAHLVGIQETAYQFLYGPNSNLCSLYVDDIGYPPENAYSPVSTLDSHISRIEKTVAKHFCRRLLVIKVTIAIGIFDKDAQFALLTRRALVAVFINNLNNALVDGL